jgi:hypothetical protein
MLKKTLLVVITICCLLMAVGCGNDETAPTDEGMISVEVANNTEEIAIAYAAFFGPGLEEFGEDMLGDEYINPGDVVVFQLPEGEYNMVLFTYELYIVESVWNINQDVKVEIGGENLFPIRVENLSPVDIAFFFALPSGTLGDESEDEEFGDNGEEVAIDNEQLLQYQLLADNDFIISESGNRFFFLEAGLYDFRLVNIEGEIYDILKFEIDAEAKKLITINQ